MLATESKKQSNTYVVYDCNGKDTGVHYDFAKQYAISIDAYDLKVKEVNYDS